MGRFDVKLLVGLNNLQGIRVNAVDKDMGMNILGIGMNGHKRLMPLQPHALEKHLHGLCDLRFSGDFILVPA